jgi:hypothetical protein
MSITAAAASGANSVEAGIVVAASAPLLASRQPDILLCMRVMLRFDLQVNLALTEQSEGLILFYFLGDFIFWVRL